ncbi:hypothetical protein BDP27DRAFT_1208449 [Rhodocollybia butyracea]|uniref:F-box domain-containing protein n=1 Tax=Rhodocollybia butyracea TaxID=206335 RepID=A0A9P5QAZ4_9AGAR|nr:hypothetical protein BDP27DRAFT_1208449 [Rhodocollybia butyracea]
MSHIHEMVQKDIKSGVEKLMLQNRGMNAVDALSTVTKEILKNNPFVPPKGCPVNDLPNELLAHIFYVGMLMEEEDDDDDFEDEEDEYNDELNLLDWDSDDEGDGPSSKTNITAKGKGKAGDDDDESEDEDEDEEPSAPFVVLVSHVCSKWRNCAIDSPLLWTKIQFEFGMSLEMQKTFLERSKEHPLVIEIDTTYPDGWVFDEDEYDEESSPEASAEHVSENGLSSDSPFKGRPPCLNKTQVSQILDIIIPSVHRWRAFCISSHLYESIHLTLERLSQCSSAPLLEIIDLTHSEDSEEYDLDVFSPPELNTKFLPFNGNAPNLKTVVLWGVHIDWDASIPLLSNLRQLRLCYHTEDVRPSFQTFSDILTSSPDLEHLTLALSGPEDKKELWGTSTINVPSVKSLDLCFHEPAYIESLLPLVHFPNLIELRLQYDSGDYTNFALLLAAPFPGRTTSILAGLESLRISCLPSNRASRQAMLEQLVNLKSIELNCAGDEDEFFERLMELKPGAGSSGQGVVFCPHLTALKTTGIDGWRMKQLVEARRRGGAPLSRVFMSEEDDLGEKEENWLRAHLEELDFFEPSSDEEEEEESDPEDEEMETEADA